MNKMRGKCFQKVLQTADGVKFQKYRAMYVADENEMEETQFSG